MNEHRLNRIPPFFLNVERLPLGIVGSNKTVLDVVTSVCSSSEKSEIRVFDLEISEALKKYAEKYPQIKLYTRNIEAKDLHDLSLVIIATNDDEYEQYVLSLCRQRNILVCVTGKPQISDFSPVSVIGTSSFKLGISSNDYSTEVISRLHRIIENSIPNDIDGLIERLKFVQKDPLMNNIDDELRELDRITAEYLDRKQKPKDSTAELENLAKVNKAVQRRANIYLGIIGVLVFLGIFSFIIVNFQLWPDIKAFLSEDNHIFYKMLAAGFFAEVVAGSMGMGYGVICTTILLMLNVAPPVVSASIHSAETFTSAAGSISHYKLKNVNMKLVKALAPAAILGAIIGALAPVSYTHLRAHET